MTDIMELPTLEPNRSAKIDSITRENYKGLVYSLDVEKDHTYIADGIPVGNSMYSFRGAHPENIQRFDKWFPGAETLILPENFRSTKSIVEFSQKVAPIKNELTKNMRTSKEQGLAVRVVNYLGTEDEVENVIQEIQKLDGRSAILARTNQQIGLFETVLTATEIKFHLLGKTGFWRTPEIKNLLNLVGFVLGTGNAETYPQTLILPLRGMVRSLPASQALQAVIDKAALRDLYSDEDYEEVDNFALGNINSAVMIANRFKTIQEFFDFAIKAQHASRKSKKAITLGTIHSAKGLEWPNVFVVGASEGKIPHEKGDPHEEKCIFYVAVSRPEKFLQISYSGQKSRFLEELEREGIKEIQA
jgi:DNA helicase-2/ATP-dependent DNA helicase PcrA